MSWVAGIVVVVVAAVVVVVASDRVDPADWSYPAQT